MIRLMKQRDSKEREIDALKEQERINKEQIIRTVNLTKRSLTNYQKWKTDNKIEGLKY